jgi:hypothetical protein
LTEDVERALGVTRDAVDEQPVQDPDLGGGEADAECLIHQPTQRPGLLDDLLVEGLDGPGARSRSTGSP